MNTLPTWDEMSDLDKGAALLHLWKRHREGASYAVSDYPCQYIENPNLLALTRREMCNHAVTVGGSDAQARMRLGDDEHERLYNLALNEGARILNSRKLWAVRFENGNISECDTRHEAEFMVYDLSWRGIELLQRDTAGGNWTVLVDARGLEQEGALGWVRPGDQVFRDGSWSEVADTGAYERTVGDVGDGLPTRWCELVDGTRLDSSYTRNETILVRRRLPPNEKAS